jgi:hypothetical protein
MARIARKTKRYPSDLTDEEWERIAPLMPKPGRRGRPREVEFREVINAVRYLLPNIPDTAGYIWRKGRLAFLGDWERSLDKIAIFNIGAYHSKDFKDHDVLASLPSSRVALDWAQFGVVPRGGIRQACRGLYACRELLGASSRPALWQISFRSGDDEGEGT